MKPNVAINSNRQMRRQSVHRSNDEKTYTNQLFNANEEE